MRIIAFIGDASTARKILDHIGESTQPPRIAHRLPLSEAARASPGDEQIYFAVGALVRSARRGEDFQCVAEKSLPFRVFARKNPVFLGKYNKEIGIDRGAADMDTPICAFDIPILRHERTVAKGEY